VDRVSPNAASRMVILARPRSGGTVVRKWTHSWADHVLPGRSVTLAVSAAYAFAHF
jgi:hypothetical protein